jgi:hypothetical protein
MEADSSAAAGHGRSQEDLKGEIEEERERD